MSQKIITVMSTNRRTRKTAFWERAALDERILRHWQDELYQQDWQLVVGYR